MSPLQALRAHCLDCCGYEEKEVALCPAVKCPSWPYRMGTNPWRKPASEARREAARRAMTNLNARRRKRNGAGPPASPPESGIAPLLAERSEAAPIWTTVRVSPGFETEQHRVDGSGGGQIGDQFRDGPISDDGGVIPAPGEASGHRLRRRLAATFASDEVLAGDLVVEEAGAVGG